MKPYDLLVDWSNWGWPLLANHLWQATLFTLFALAAAASLRRAPAGARYFVWLIALAKFALPSAFLMFLVGRAGVDLPALTRAGLTSPQGTLDVSPFLSPVAVPATVWRAVETPAQGAGPSAVVVFAASTQETSHLYGVVTCVWLAGCALLLASWLRRRRRLSAVLKKGRVVTDGREADALRRVRAWFALRQEISLVITPAISEPGVCRVWRPVVVLPEGVPEQLDDAELEAVFMHELSHIERWDNLVDNLQRALCCLFWFHPVVWMIDRRLLAEREQACDDAVVRRGGASEVYAKGITKVCRYCLGWDVAGLSKVAGSDLKKRIERIISDGAGKKISALQLSVVGFTAAAALSFSVASGEVTGVEFVTPGGDDRAVADSRFEVRDTADGGGRTAAGGRPQAGDTGGGRAAENVPGQQLRRESAATTAQAAGAAETPIEVRASTESIEDWPSAPSARVAPPDAERQSPPPPPREPDSADNIRAAMVKASGVDYGDLKRFIGRYEVDPQRAENFVLDVTLEGGALWLKPSHSPGRRLIRQSETDFSDSSSQFQFTYILDGADRVVGLRLNSWGRNVTARRLALPAPSTKGNTVFRLSGFPDARVVAVAGTFNDWNQSQLLFARDGDEWVCRVNLPPGTHQYKFIVDGNWLTDPGNPRTVHDRRGFENSLLRAE